MIATHYLKPVKFSCTRYQAENRCADRRLVALLFAHARGAHADIAAKVLRAGAFKTAMEHDLKTAARSARFRALSGCLTAAKTVTNWGGDVPS